MRRSLINLYIQRAADGDEGYAEKLCAQLAERLLYVPTTPQSGDGDDGGVVKVHVLRLQEEHRSIVPVFSSESAIEQWTERNAHTGGQLSLLGADLAQALGPQVWIRLDDGEEASIELQPQLVKLISESSPVAMEEEFQESEPEPPTIEPAVHEAAAEPVRDEAVPLVQVYNGPEIPEAEQTIEASPVTTPTPEKPKKRKFLDFLRTGRD